MKARNHGKLFKMASFTGLFLALLFSGGCLISPVGTSDEDNIRNMLEDDGITSGLEMLTMESFGDDDDYIYIKREYDIIDMVMSLNLVITGDEASAEVNYFINGTFSSMTADSTVFEKDISEDSGVRDLYLTKDGDRGKYGGWRISDLTVLAGSSIDENLEIEEITISSSSVGTIVFDDPTEFWERDVLTFSSGEEVTITVEVNDDNIIPLVHCLTSGATVERKILEPVPGEDRLFRNVYEIAADSGIHHTFLDIIDRDAVISDAPYSAVAWGMPYWVD